MFYPDKKFISTLSAGERFIFLKIICGAVACNRQISKEELLYLKEVALKYEVNAEDLAKMIKSSDKSILMKQAHLIKNRSNALVLIKDMCMVANVDTNLDNHEIDYIIDIANCMGIEGKRVQDINALVNEYLTISQKARLLLEQENWT